MTTASYNSPRSLEFVRKAQKLLLQVGGAVELWTGTPAKLVDGICRGVDWWTSE